VAGFEGPEAPDELLRRCASGELGGLILFRRNLDNVHQASALIARFVHRSPRDLPLLVAVDQEGGRVARLRTSVLPLPPMRQLAALGDPALTRRAAALLGRQLGAIGFSMNLAPVLDVDTNPDNPVIGDRSFGTTPELVLEQALAFAAGLADGGVLSCGKHFPGHGDTALDSHLALPRLTHTRERLERVELRPFRGVKGQLPALMTAHVIFDAVTGDTPATLSPAAVSQLLRHELGFEGLILTDDMEMKAIADHWGIEQAAVLAIEAGCDQLLICSRLDWLARAHAALVERANRDATFLARLRDAAERCVATRSSCPPRPITDPAELSRALLPEETAQLSREIETRLAALRLDQRTAHGDAG
jgi:beta-N-acetylhexosaminidase